MISAILKLLCDRKSLFVFIISAMFFFALFIAIPVWTIPANTLSFQIKIFRMQDYALMTLLAILAGLTIALQVYGYKIKKVKQVLPQSVLQSTASGGLGIFGAIVGTATCASCLAFLFGLIGLGAGSVFFVLKNHTLFLSVLAAAQ